jgi:hypothetical protein
MTGLITAAAVGVAGLGMSAYEMSQQNSLSSSALGLAQNTQSEQEYYNSLLQQLIANPSSVTQLPGYASQMKQGTAAVASQMGSSGFAGSGNEAAALETFGQGLASSFYGQQANLLASLSGVTAASSPAADTSAATGASSLVSSNLSSLLNSIGFYGALGLSRTGASAGTPGAGTYTAPAAGSGVIDG